MHRRSSHRPIFQLQPCVVVRKHADLSIACKDCICICVFSLQLKIFLSQATSEVYNGALWTHCSEALLVDFSVKETPLQCILIRFCSMSNRCLMRFADNAFSKMKPLKLYHSLRQTPKIRHGQHSCVSEETVEISSLSTTHLNWTNPRKIAKVTIESFISSAYDNSKSCIHLYE